LRHDRKDSSFCPYLSFSQSPFSALNIPDPLPPLKTNPPFLPPTFPQSTNNLPLYLPPRRNSGPVATGGARNSSGNWMPASIWLDSWGQPRRGDDSELVAVKAASGIRGGLGATSRAARGARRAAKPELGGKAMARKLIAGSHRRRRLRPVAGRRDGRAEVFAESDRRFWEEYGPARDEFLSRAGSHFVDCARCRLSSASTGAFLQIARGLRSGRRLFIQRLSLGACLGRKNRRRRRAAGGGGGSSRPPRRPIFSN